MGVDAQRRPYRISVLVACPAGVLRADLRGIDSLEGRHLDDVCQGDEARSGSDAGMPPPATEGEVDGTVGDPPARHCSCEKHVSDRSERVGGRAESRVSACRACG